MDNEDGKTSDMILPAAQAVTRRTDGNHSSIAVKNFGIKDCIDLRGEVNFA